MNPYKMFKTDGTVETEGLWLDYGDFEIRIARAGGANTKYKNALKARLKQYKHQVENDLMSDEVSRKLMAGIYADTIILGWRTKVRDGEGNVTGYNDGFIPDENDEPMEWNRENCVKLLMDLPVMFTDIHSQANSVSNWRAEEVKRNVKK